MNKTSPKIGDLVETQIAGLYYSFEDLDIEKCSLGIKNAIALKKNEMATIIDCLKLGDERHVWYVVLIRNVKVIHPFSTFHKYFKVKSCG